MTSGPDSTPDRAEVLNRDCHCRTLDRELLRGQLERDPHLQGLLTSLQHTRPSLFAATAVFISHDVYLRIRRGIQAIERIIGLPAYQSTVLSQAPEAAQRDFGPLGVFTSYDFHIGAHGPRLIEINSNAGGALLATALAQAQQACCQPMCSTPADVPLPREAEQRFIDMFMREWRLQRTEGEPGNLLIVDDEPAGQYLAPEFELFRRLFESRGIASAIVDAATLRWRDGRLWHGETAVDMVYNRLTDFYLEEPRHAALRKAWLAGAVVVTPHPRTHALYADKRNLLLLSDAARLQSWGVNAEDRAAMSKLIPHCALVEPDNAQQLWAARKQFFFKPTAGFGAKAAWRGDKITRRVWAEVTAGRYLAQELVPPAERAVMRDGEKSRLKFDLRAYSYAGEIQLLSARMYAGQTTNFRTPGGGFAAVAVLSADAQAPLAQPSSG